jgi:hypothetical protein
MKTCQTINGPTMSVLLPLATNVVSTPPGARTWLAPGSTIAVYKVESTLNTASDLVTKNYNIK